MATVLMLTTSGQAQTSWKLVWEDEFDGTELDTTRWTAVTDCGDHRNTEQQCYMASAVSVGNGMLTITGTNQAQNGYSYTSGAIKTGNWSSPSKFTQAYGRFEFRAQLPAGGQGIWPALWLYPPRQWPPEIDLVEAVNTMSTIYMTYHWGTESTHQQDGSSTTISNPGDWHIYAMEWETNEIRWYIDGVLKKTHTGTDVTDIPMQLYINLALGGIWPGPVGGSTVFPQFLHVDYVRAYHPDSTVPIPTDTHNLALHKPTTASSSETSSLSSANAVDGLSTTRWASVYSDPQWLQVDLQDTFPINRIKLMWETAYASAYQLQVAIDTNNWNTVYSTTTGNGGTDSVTFSPVAARYVRMYGTARATQYGYSLYEMAVYSDSGTTVIVKSNNALVNTDARIHITELVPGSFALGFVLPDKRDIRLSVYTVRGQKVYGASLAGVKEGIKTITLNHPASGVYFCVIDIGDRILTRKLVIAM
ncbi:MAG: discoidin domain-containing protein [Fibrobacterota bacterium]